MSSTCEVYERNGVLCRKLTIAGYEYGRGGPVLAVCVRHDEEIKYHIRTCRTTPDSDGVIGDCQNYLKRLVYSLDA